MPICEVLNIFDEAFLTRLSTLRFTGEILAVPEGTVIFPGEPIVRVIAPIMEAQLLETALLNIINHQTLIATKASRVVQAAARRQRCWNSACAARRGRMRASTARARR